MTILRDIIILYWMNIIFDFRPLAAREVRLAWSAYLELVVEPAGWRAVLVPR